MAEKRWKWAALIAVFAVIVFAGAAVKKAKVRSFTGIIESVSGVTAVVETDDLRDEYIGTVRVSVILDSETAARAAVGDELLVTYTGPFMETSPLQVSGQQSAELVKAERERALR